MTEFHLRLDDDFRAKATAALLDDVERELEASVQRAIEHSHDVLRSYDDYDTESIIESLGEPTIVREGNTVVAQWGWEHEAAPYFEFGTSDHTISGNPILSFIWEDAPPSIHEMFPNTERVDGDPRVFFAQTEVSGIKETRFVRAGLQWLERHLS